MKLPTRRLIEWKDIQRCLLIALAAIVGAVVSLVYAPCLLIWCLRPILGNAAFDLGVPIGFVSAPAGFIVCGALVAAPTARKLTVFVLATLWGLTLYNPVLIGPIEPGWSDAHYALYGLVGASLGIGLVAWIERFRVKK